MRDMPIAVVLPWPSRKLSPNANAHWRVKAEEKRKYRKACCVETIRQAPPAPREGMLLRLEMAFSPPDRRRYDVDNLLASMKSGIDGMCDALAIDDSGFDSVLVKKLDRDPEQDGGCVYVRIVEVE